MIQIQSGLGAVAPRAALAALALALAVQAGCATVPKVTAQPAAAAHPPMIGARGPLSLGQARALVARLTPTPGENALLRHHLAIEQAVSDEPLVAGETTRLLRDGPATFRAMFAAMREARTQINLEYFIVEDVAIDGERLSDLLLAKRREGVAVNLIYDSYGSLPTPVALLATLRQAGVQVVEYNPVNPLKAKVGYAPNDRDHRKILTVDGRIALVGGVNLSKTYEPGSPEHWRDTDLELTGPAVARLQALFVEHWRAQHGPALGGPEAFPPPAATGAAIVRILGSSPGDGEPRYYATLVSALRGAERSITASAAYFAPTRDETKALIDAARRGVTVTLLLPDRSDSGLTMAVGHSHYDDLLEAGVRIYETHDEVLHAKTVVIDGVWSAVGSSNFDHRSIVYNDEVDAVVLGADSAQALEAMFAADEARARPVDLATWRRRPIAERLREAYAKVWVNLL